MAYCFAGKSVRRIVSLHCWNFFAEWWWGGGGRCSQACSLRAIPVAPAEYVKLFRVKYSCQKSGTQSLFLSSTEQASQQAFPRSWAASPIACRSSCHEHEASCYSWCGKHPPLPSHQGFRNWGGTGQRSTPKWALVGGCRRCKLAHALTYVDMHTAASCMPKSHGCTCSSQLCRNNLKLRKTKYSA